jgi:hypothetical protein
VKNLSVLVFLVKNLPEQLFLMENLTAVHFVVKNLAEQLFLVEYISTMYFLVKNLARAAVCGGESFSVVLCDEESCSAAFIR